MDFGALPPEINSTRMYSGPGSAPLHAASAAWNLLATELVSAASLYQSTIDVLTDDEWLGPTSASMAAAVDPYITWMNTTGAQAEQTAVQASSAASAYEAAFAMTVPPVEVAANRAQLMALIASNVLGQNTPAIAATEAQYGEMWAQDAAAMYGYAGNSAAATVVKPFAQPPQMTNSDAEALQSSTLANAVSTTTGSGAQTQLSQLISTVPSALQQLTSPASSTTNTAVATTTLSNPFADILNFLSGQNGDPIGNFLNSQFFNGIASAGYGDPAIVTAATTSGLSDINSLGAGAAVAPGGGFGVPGYDALVSPQRLASMPSLGGVTVDTSGARLVGKLSVPPTWTASAQVANHSGVTFAGGGWTNAVGPTGGGTEAGAAGMPGMPGAASSRSGGFGHGPRYGMRLTVIPRPPSAG
jgi:PPE-repeat protein